MSPRWYSVAMLAAMPPLQRERAGFTERLGHYLAQPAPKKSYSLHVGKKTVKPQHLLLGDPIQADGKGVPKDPAAAARWLLMAAEQGHGRAQNNLSTFYFTGVGVKRDPVEAWKWLTLSADDLKGAGRDIALENRKVIEAELNAKLSAAEQTIAATKATAMGNVRAIATEAAAAIVERLIGTAPAGQDVDRAVADVLKR